MLNLLALDVSMKSTGFCIVTVVGNRVRVITSGVIPTKDSQTHGQRLHVIRNAVLELERDYGPLDETIARERGFSRYNKATQVLYRVHGVIEEAFHQHKVAEYAPIQVKREISGSAKASKQQVADAVQQWLTSRVEFATDDESDALAVAICHLLKTGQLTEVSTCQ